MSEFETDCFCGCGRSAAFGQARNVSAAARRVEGLLRRLPRDDARRPEAERLLRLARGVLHDDAPHAARVAVALAAWAP